MRTEINPYKKIIKGEKPDIQIKDKAKIPKKVTLCITTHIPNKLGYYRERLKILDLCISSLKVNTDEKLYDLLILNNGSNAETYEFLSNKFSNNEIDYLIHSKENLGVTNSLSIILSSAPGEYICRIDDDVFFKQGWLDECLKIIESYPNVGFVTPFPVRSSYNKIYSSAFYKTYQNLKGIEYLDSNWNKSWDEIVAYGLGTNLEDFIKKNPLNEIKKLRYKNITAYPLGSHFVSLCRKGTLKEILPFPYNDRLIGGSIDDKTSLINLFDQALDDLGLVKLTTDGCYVEHMGNKIDDHIINLGSSLKKQIRISKDVEFKVDKLNFFEYLIVLIFSLPFVRRIPKLSNKFFDRIIYLKTQKQYQKKSN